MASYFDGTGVFIRNGRETVRLFLCMGTEERPCEDTVNRWPFTNQKRALPRNQTCHTLVIKFQTAKCKNINVVYLNHIVCTIL